ncbi:hypothetical protein E2C01_058225 [Portunus trituberculatus]|uniref:Uncharacterized protein n=1 Tax=Portunus trituberculatus TaxID=210409 RepID=A0A5B7H5H5_PORTR|nr:hypothetical protein [Portunus trituberculatus]
MTVTQRDTPFSPLWPRLGKAQGKATPRVTRATNHSRVSDRVSPPSPQSCCHGGSLLVSLS